LIDPQGVDLNRFYRDYADCSRLAAAVDPTGQALTGAGVGAVIGALVGNTQRVEGDGVRGALWGAGLGAGVALSAAEQERQQVLRRCLRNRGYAVIR
jgi:CubicO group peptidase (beta-lactamase class C family)